MFTEQTLILINVACIFFLVIILIILAAATRMKGGAGWAAMIVVSMCVPAYLIPFSLTLTPGQFLWFIYPTITLNVMLIPFLWFFIHSQLDKSFRISWRSIPHFLPALISLVTNIIHYSGISSAQIAEEMKLMLAGIDNQPTIINNILLYSQVAVYFPLVVRYSYKRMKYLKNNFSDSDYYTVKWVPGFIFVLFGLLVGVAISYIISPLESIWITPLLNVLGMAYLVYSVIYHSTAAYINRLPDEADIRDISAASNEKQSQKPEMSNAQMKEICDRLIEYLLSSKAYTNPDLSLSMLSVDTKIASKNISRAINSYLNKSFFDLINEMRVDEAKKRLRQLNINNHTVDSVAGECGFSSRSSFFAIFKKTEGMTPSQWIKTQKL